MSDEQNLFDASTSTVVPVQQVMGPSAFFSSIKSAGITEFDGKNYFAWRAKLGAVLRGLGLSGLLETDVVDPVKDRELGDLLLLCLSGPLTNVYRNFLSSGKETLRRLDAEYNRKDVGSKHAALTRLLSYKYRGNGVKKHCDDVIQLMNELADTGLVLESELMVCILLFSLPAELSTFVSTICGQDGNSLTIDAVRMRAIAEEARLRGTEGELALPVKGKPPFKNTQARKRKAKEKVKCFRCQGNHYVRDCPQPRTDMAALIVEPVTPSRSGDFSQNVDFEREAKRVKEDPMDWTNGEVEIKSYRTPPKETVVAPYVVPETAGTLRVPRSEDDDCVDDLVVALGGKSWTEARAERPTNWIWLTNPQRLAHIRRLYPKYDDLGLGSKGDFKKLLWKIETEEHRKQLREKNAKAAKEKAEKEKAAKAKALTEAVDNAIEEVIDSEKVLVGSTGGLDNKSTSNYVFVIDSGATSHMVQSSDLMSDFSVEKTVIQQAEKGREIVSIGRGTVKGQVFPDNVKLTLTDVMLIPSMGFNVISVRRLCSKGYEVIFLQESCVVRKKGVELLHARKKAGLYQLTMRDQSMSSIEKVLSTVERGDKLSLWHHRLGHLNEDEVRRMLPEVKFDSGRLNCVSCIEGKMSRSKFTERLSRSQKKFELVHSDVCGPFEVAAIGGHKYFVTFIDDFSGYCVLNLIRQKSEVLGKFKELFEMIKSKYRCTIGTLRSDNGGEYSSKAFEKYLKEKGIHRQFSTPYTPQQNGVAERMNRTLQNSARTMLLHANLSKRYWGYAVKHAVFIRNMCPSPSTKRKAPVSLLTGEVPKLDGIYVFGCVCYAHIPEEKRKKLDPKAVKCIFLGHSESSKGYIVQNTVSATLSVNRDVKFLEDQFISTKTEEVELEQRELEKNKVRFSEDVVYYEIPARERVIPEVFRIPRLGSGSSESSSMIDSLETSSPIDSLATSSPIDSLADNSQDVSTSASSPTADTRSLNGSSELSEVEMFEDALSTMSEDRGDDRYPCYEQVDRGVRQRSRYEWEPVEVLPPKDINGPPQFSKRKSYYRDETRETLLVANGEPESYREALESRDSEKWLTAMKDEMQSMYQNQTWELVKPPEGRKVVDCRWVYKIKQGYDDIPPRYKARLCARGFSQVYGLDFEETYAPVVKFTSVRIFLVKAILMKMKIHQMDVVTAFLYAPIDEEIYMKQAPGFEEPGKERLVCRLKKSIYGLKQSPRLWNKVMDDFLKNEGFIVIDADCCIYMKRNKRRTIMVSLYVDDLLIASDCKTLCAELKLNLNKRFEMKDLGIVKVCLGIEFNWLPNGTCLLNQRKYIENVLKRFNMQDCKPIGCPIEGGARLSKDMAPKTKEEIQEMEKVPYRHAVGSLIYLVTGTRPDLAVATSSVAKFCENPGPAHWTAVKRILRYLKGTSDWGILFNPKDDILVGYSDADWAGDPDSRRSTTGYLFTIGGVPVSWKSKKQATVALSTAEAEYMALATAAQEVSWLRKFLVNFGLDQNEATVIYEDNQGCIALAKNPVSHERTKHIDIRYHFIRELVEAKTIDLQYLPTADMLADLLTKGMVRDRHLDLCRRLNVIGLSM